MSAAGATRQLGPPRLAHERVEALDRFLRVRELLLAELHLPPVVRLQDEQPERARIEPVEDVLEGHEVAE